MAAPPATDEGQAMPSPAAEEPAVTDLDQHADQPPSSPPRDEAPAPSFFATAPPRPSRSDGPPPASAPPPPPPGAASPGAGLVDPTLVNPPGFGPAPAPVAPSEPIPRTAPPPLPDAPTAGLVDPTLVTPDPPDADTASDDLGAAAPDSPEVPQLDPGDDDEPFDATLIMPAWSSADPTLASSSHDTVTGPGEPSDPAPPPPAPESWRVPPPPPEAGTPPAWATTITPSAPPPRATRPAQEKVWVPPGARPARTADGPLANKPLLIAIGAIVAVVLLGAAIVALVGGDGDEQTAAAPTTTTEAATTTTEEPAPSGRIPIGAGITAIVPDGALTPGARIEAELIDTPSSVGPLVTPAGAVASIVMASGRQLAPIELEMPYEAVAGPVAPDSAAPGLVFALRRDSDVWTPVAGVLDPAAGTLTFPTRSLGTIGVFTWADPTFTDSLRALLQGRASDPVEGAATPQCANDARREVQVSNPDGALAWCAERGGDGSRTVRVINTRRHVVSVRAGDGVTASRDSGDPLTERFAERAAVADPAVSLVGPGATASFTVPPGAEGQLDVSVTGLANAATTLPVAVEALALFANRVEWVPDVTGLVVTDRVIQSGCVEQIDPGVAADAAAWDTVLEACVPPALVGAVVGDDAAPLLSALLAGLGDGPLFQATYDNHLQAMAARAATFTVTDLNRWPVDDQDGGPLYLQWLADQGFGAQWRSCSVAHCIAGDGTDVLLTGLDPLRDRARISQGAADPTQALIDNGMSPEEAAQLLRPGPPG